MWLYQRTGRTNFDELWVSDSTLNEGTNFLVNMRIGAGRMVCCALSYNECHKTHNGWYSGMMVPTVDRENFGVKKSP